MPVKTTLLNSYFCETLSLNAYINALGIHAPVKSICSSLLDKVVVTVKHDCQLFPQNYSRDCVISTNDLIHHAIEHLCSLKISNIISQGYSFIREGSKKSMIAGSHLQITYLNSIVVYLKRKPWEDLHRVIGDDILFYLLVNTWLFLSIEHGCFIQLTGKPLYNMTVKTCDDMCRQELINTKIIIESDIGNKRGLKRKMVTINSKCKKRKLTNDKSSKIAVNEKMKETSTSKLKKGTELEPLVFERLTKKGKRQLNNNNKKTPANSYGKAAQKAIYIQRSKMFYSKILLEDIEKKHILRLVHASNNGVLGLSNHIFKFSQDDKVKRLPKHLIGFKYLFKSMITNFKCIKIKRLLNYYCPVAKWLQWKNEVLSKKSKIISKTVSFGEKVRYKFAARSFVPPNKVYQFLRAVLKKIVPDMLFGCEKNKGIFMKNVLNFVLLGRYEKLTVKRIMFAIKISSFNFLMTKQSDTKLTKQQSLKYKAVVLKLFQWLFNSLVVPILRGYFYITESGCHKNRVFYYRKPIWKVMHDEGLKSIIGHIYKPLANEVVKKKLIDGDCIGVHDIRLIPGQNKLRPIANMNRCFGGKDGKQKVRINYQLKDLHLALRYEMLKNLSLAGATVSTSTEVFNQFKSFVSLIKTKYEDLPPFYFVSVDISRCFDTLPHDQLLNYIPQLLKEDTYLVRRFTKLKSSQNRTVSKKTCCVAAEGTDCDNFVDFIRTRLKNGTLVGQNVVFVDRVYRILQTREHLLEGLKKHISCNIGKLENQYVIQDTGVPQGSILATILNNLHYGNIENEYLKDLIRSHDSILMRWVDDYIYITTARVSAERFISIMYQSMPSYGCQINLKKTLLNFDVTLHGTKLLRIHSDWLPWCGYLINSQTLEVSYNYVQYVGENLKDGMTIQCGSTTGSSLSRMLLQATSVKATGLIVDPFINSSKNVQKNIYQVFRYIAIKFHVHVKAEFQGKDLERRFWFFVNLIKKLPLEFIRSCGNNFFKSKLLSRRLSLNGSMTSFTSSGSFSHMQKVSIDRNLVKFLCYQAFVDSLRVKQTRYGKLIAVLVKELEHLNHVIDHVDVNHLRKHSSLFTMIKT